MLSVVRLTTYFLLVCKVLTLRSCADESFSIGFRKLKQRDFINLDHMEACLISSYHKNENQNSTIATTNTAISIHQWGEQWLHNDQAIFWIRGESVLIGYLSCGTIKVVELLSSHIAEAPRQRQTFTLTLVLAEALLTFSMDCSDPL